MVVFVETVILENLLIDSLLLWLVLKSLRLRTNWAGLLLAGLFGAGFALASPLIQVGGVLAILIKIAAALFMSIMLCLNFRKLLFKTGLFLLYTFAFGGCLIAIFTFMGVRVVDGMALGYLSDIPLGAMLAGAIIFAIVLSRALSRVFKMAKVVRFCRPISITVNNRRVDFQGFLDTGNTLTSSGGRPVVVVGSGELKRWFEPSQQFCLLMKKFDKLNLKNAEVITVKSLAGKQTLLVFDAEDCSFGHKKVEVAVGVCGGGFRFGDHFNAILSPGLLED